MNEQCQRPLNPPTQRHRIQSVCQRSHLAHLSHLNIKHEDSIHFEDTILNKMSRIQYATAQVKITCLTC